MPKKTMTFSQFMNAVNNHYSTNSNQPKNVKKRGNITKGDYETGLFGGGQGSSSSSGAPGAAQAAAQAAAQRAAQQAQQRAAQRADAVANQQAAQARAAQQASQAVSQPASNGAAAAAQAAATRPVYSANTGNGAAVAAQNGNTRDAGDIARDRRRAEEIAAITRRRALDAAQQNGTSLGAQVNGTSDNDIGQRAYNALADLLRPASVANAAVSQPKVIPTKPAQPTIGTAPTATTAPVATTAPIDTTAPTTTVNAEPTTTVNAEPTALPVRTMQPTAGVPTAPVVVATAAPPTAASTAIPTATYTGGAMTEAQKAAIALVNSGWKTDQFPANIKALFQQLGIPANQNPMLKNPPLTHDNFTSVNMTPLAFNPTEVSADGTPGPTPTYGPLSKPWENQTLHEHIKQYLQQGLEDGPLAGSGWLDYLNAAQPGTAQSKDMVGHPAWHGIGNSINANVVASASNAVSDAVVANKAERDKLNLTGTALVPLMQTAVSGVMGDNPNNQGFKTAAQIAAEYYYNKKVNEERLAALGQSGTDITTLQDNMKNPDKNQEYKLPGYNALYKPSAVSVPAPATLTTSATDSANPTRTRGSSPVTTTGNSTVETPTGTPDSNASTISWLRANGFNPYGFGTSVEPDYVNERVYGNVAPAGYTPLIPSPTQTPTTQRTAAPAVQQTQTPTPIVPRTTPTVSNLGMQIKPSVTPQKTPPSGVGGNAAPAFGRGLGVGGGAGAMIGQNDLVRAIQQLLGNQQITQRQAASAYPQFATAQKRQKGKLKKDIGVGTGLTAHATQPVAESPMPRAHTSYGNYKFKKPLQENRSAKYGESQQLQQTVRKQMDVMQPHQTMTNPMQYPPSRAPQNILNPMPLDSNESMMFKKYIGSESIQPVQSNDKYIPSYLQRNKQR